MKVHVDRYCDYTQLHAVLQSCDLLQDELDELQKPKEKVTLLQFIKRPSLRLPLLISIVLHLSQQLTGIGGVSNNFYSITPPNLNLTLTQVLYYSTEIFKAAGVKHGDIATVVVVGLTLVTFTLITVSKSMSLTFLSCFIPLKTPNFRYFSSKSLVGELSCCTELEEWPFSLRSLRACSALRYVWNGSLIKSLFTKYTLQLLLGVYVISCVYKLLYQFPKDDLSLHCVFFFACRRVSIATNMLGRQ